MKKNTFEYNLKFKISPCVWINIIEGKESKEWNGMEWKVKERK